VSALQGSFDYSSGAPMLFNVLCFNATGSGLFYDFESGNAPKLQITYTEGGAGGDREPDKTDFHFG
jgi:hypothetical protein